MTIPGEPVSIFGVYERGVANKERVVLYVDGPTNLREYALGLGIRQPLDFFIPVPDFFLWLGDMAMGEPGWVFIHTGKGQRSVTREMHTSLAVQNLFWGRETTLFSSNEVIPVVYRFGQVLIGNGPNRSLIEVPSYLQKQAADMALGRTK